MRRLRQVRMVDVKVAMKIVGRCSVGAQQKGSKQGRAEILAGCCQADRGHVAASQLQADVWKPLQPPYHSRSRTTGTSFSRIFLKSFQSLPTDCYHPSTLILMSNIKTMNHNDYEDDDQSSVTERDSACPESRASFDARPTSHKTRRKMNKPKSRRLRRFPPGFRRVPSTDQEALGNSQAQIPETTHQRPSSCLA